MLKPIVLKCRPGPSCRYEAITENSTHPNGLKPIVTESFMSNAISAPVFKLLKNFGKTMRPLSFASYKSHKSHLRNQTRFFFDNATTS